MILNDPKYCRKCQYMVSTGDIDEETNFMGAVYKCKLAGKLGHVFGRQTRYSINPSAPIEMGWYTNDHEGRARFDRSLRLEVPEKCPYILEMALDATQ